jgi:hypothetical protein
VERLCESCRPSWRKDLDNVSSGAPPAAQSLARMHSSVPAHRISAIDSSIPTRPGQNLARQTTNSIDSNYSAKNPFARPESMTQQVPVQVMPTLLPSAASSYQQAPQPRQQPQSYQKQARAQPAYSQPARPASQAVSTNQKQVRAMFDFDAENPNELSSK